MQKYTLPTLVLLLCSQSLLAERVLPFPWGQSLEVTNVLIARAESMYLVADTSLQLDSIGAGGSIGWSGDPCDTITSANAAGISVFERKMLCRAQHVINTAQDVGDILQGLSGGNLLELPFKQTFSLGDGTSVTVAISAIEFHPSKAVAKEFFVKIESAKLEDPLYFGALNIDFTRSGGILELNLPLLADFRFRVFNNPDGEGDAFLTLKKADMEEENGQVSFADGSYLAMSCNDEGRLDVDSVHLEALVEFSRKWVKPVNEAGEISTDESETVHADVSFGMSNGFDDWLFDLDIGRFVITGAEKVKWQVNKMVFDFSDTQNSPLFNIPAWYEPYFGFSGSPDLWTGFYVDSFQVTLPDFLKKEENPGEEIWIRGTDIIVDQGGFSGIVEAGPQLVEFGKVKADGWGMSVDSFLVHVIQQNLERLEFNGALYVPLFKNKDKDFEDESVDTSDCFTYEAVYNNLEEKYSVSVSNTDEHTVPLVIAKATIAPNSEVKLTYFEAEDQLDITAILHGDISLGADEYPGGLALNMEDISFDSLQLSNQSPHIQVGKWDIPTGFDLNFMGFGIAVHNIAPFSDASESPEEAGIELDMRIEFDNQLKLSADAGLAIIGYLDQEQGFHQWKFDRIRVDSVCIQGSFAGVDTLHGCVYYFDQNDSENCSEFGTGYRGSMTIQFKGLSGPSGEGGLMVGFVGQFGTSGQGADAFKYFMVDGRVEGLNIQIAPGLEITGFGGGLYRHMTMDDPLVAFASMQAGQGPCGDLGTSLSGISYNPDFSTKIGVMATILFQTVGNTNTLNGSLTFGIEFGTTEGGDGGVNLSRIYFAGQAQFMMEPDIALPPMPEGAGLLTGDGLNLPNLTENMGSGGEPTGDAGALPEIASGETIQAEASMKAFLLIDLNFETDVYVGLLDVSLNANAGKFAKSESKIWAQLFINKPAEEWFLHVGTPCNRNYMKARIDVPLLTVETALTGYFMMGNHTIPSQLPPPFDVTNIPGNESDCGDPVTNSNYEGSSVMSCYASFCTPPELDASFFSDDDYNTTRITGPLENGAGLALGAGFHLGLSADLINLGIASLTADLNAGVGFDMNLFKHSNDECVDMIGIDGWYVSGQAWAYFYGSLSAEIKLLILKKRIELLSGTLAANVLLQGPNPIYGRATLYGRLQALGLIEISANLDIEFGELPDPESNCAFEQYDPLADIKMLKEIFMENSTDLYDVDVYDNVIVTFEVEHNSIFEFPDYDSEGMPTGTNTVYQVRFDQATLQFDPEVYEAGTPDIMDFKEPWTFAEDLMSVKLEPTNGSIEDEEDYLMPNRYYKVFVRATLYELEVGSYQNGNVVPGPGGNIIWDVAYTEEGQRVQETMTLHFYTGEGGPSHFEAADVLLSYPLANQEHFHIGQVDFYQLYLRKNLPSVFMADPPEGCEDVMARFTDDSGAEVDQVPVISYAANVTSDFDNIYGSDPSWRATVRFEESAQIQLDQPYTFEVIRTCVDTTHIYYETDFHTSKYHTFEEKVDAMYRLTSIYDDGGDNTSKDDVLVGLFKLGEGLDNYETEGVSIPGLDFPPMWRIIIEGELCPNPAGDNPDPNEEVETLPVDPVVMGGGENTSGNSSGEVPFPETVNMGDAGMSWYCTFFSCFDNNFYPACNNCPNGDQLKQFYLNYTNIEAPINPVDYDFFNGPDILRVHYDLPNVIYDFYEILHNCAVLAGFDDAEIVYETPPQGSDPGNPGGGGTVDPDTSQSAPMPDIPITQGGDPGATGNNNSPAGNNANKAGGNLNGNGQDPPGQQQGKDNNQGDLAKSNSSNSPQGNKSSSSPPTSMKMGAGNGGGTGYSGAMLSQTGNGLIAIEIGGTVIYVPGPGGPQNCQAVSNCFLNAEYPPYPPQDLFPGEYALRLEYYIPKVTQVGSTFKTITIEKN